MAEMPDVVVSVQYGLINPALRREAEAFVASLSHVQRTGVIVEYEAYEKTGTVTPQGMLIENAMGLIKHLHLPPKSVKLDYYLDLLAVLTWRFYQRELFGGYGAKR